MNTLVILMKNGTVQQYTYMPLYSMDIQILNGDYCFTYVDENYDVKTLRIKADDVLEIAL